MKKTAKRTDLAIIITLVIIALLIIFSVKTGNDSPEAEGEQVTLESFNGRPMGAQPGSPSEAVIYFLLAWGISLLLTAVMKRFDSRRKGGKVR